MLYRAGVPRHAIIKKLASKDISNLQDLINVLSNLSKGARVPLEYISYTDRHRRKSVLVTVDRHEWYAPPQIYTRDDDSGIWVGKQALVVGPTLEVIKGVDVDVGEQVANGNNVTNMDDSSSDNGNGNGNASVAERVIEPTLVMFEVNYKIESEIFYI